MRLLRIMSLLLALSILQDSKASAGNGIGVPPSSPPAGVDDGGVIGVSVSTGGGGAGATAVGSSPVKCQWVLAAPDQATSDNPYDTKVIAGVTYRHYLRICPGEVTRYWLADRTPQDVAESASSDVRRRLPKPTLGSAPPRTSAIVNLDMWLWTDPAEFREVSVTASVATVAGALSATATARPLRLVFDPGEPDSERIFCEGPGERWFPSDGEQASSACMYAYLHSSSISATGTFTATWSIVWQITWTSSTGASGVLDDAYLTTSTVEMTVNEVQALVTG